MNEFKKIILNKEFSIVSALKREIIADIITKYFNLPLNKEIGSRVTCIRIERNPFYEKYLLDANTENERLILEFDFIPFVKIDSNLKDAPGFHITILKEAQKFLKY